MPGMGEMIVILLIVLLIFGAGKLPEIGDALGRSIKNFKRASNGQDEIEVSKKALPKKSAKELEASDASDELAGDEAEEADVVPARKKVKQS
jgi:sec-independent protein translocase protein TatA